MNLLLTVGCAKKAAYELYAPMTSALVAPGEAPRGEDLRRYVAVRHKLAIEFPEGELPKAWASAIEFCGTIRCEILASSLSNKTPDSPPSGSLSVRLAPEDLQKFFDHFAKSGNVLEHTTQSEDKTAAVIDTEAEIKNLTGFRDSLRAMLAKPPSNVKDLLEVQRELSRVQSQLDGIVTKRKVLANETEKVAVEITFRSKRSVARTGAFAPIASAWRESGSVLSESIATLFTAVVAVIPWLLVLVPAVWVLSKILRRLRGRRTPSR